MQGVSQQSEALSEEELKAILVTVNSLKYFSSTVVLETSNAGDLCRQIIAKSSASANTSK